MHHLNISNIKKVALVCVLAVGSLGLTACSSPEEDAAVREEPVQHIDAQTPVEQAAIHTTDDIAVAEDNTGTGSIDVGTQNNPDVLDGTDEVEHVSTY